MQLASLEQVAWRDALDRLEYAAMQVQGLTTTAQPALSGANTVQAQPSASDAPTTQKQPDKGE